MPQPLVLDGERLLLATLASVTGLVFPQACDKRKSLIHSSETNQGYDPSEAFCRVRLVWRSRQNARCRQRMMSTGLRLQRPVLSFSLASSVCLAFSPHPRARFHLPAMSMAALATFVVMHPDAERQYISKEQRLLQCIVIEPFDKKRTFMVLSTCQKLKQLRDLTTTMPIRSRPVPG